MNLLSCGESPERIKAEKRSKRLAEIKEQLAVLDAAKVRPLAAIVTGSGTEDDQFRLAELNVASGTLREEIRRLGAA